jgi:hypothetical protein
LSDQEAALDWAAFVVGATVWACLSRTQRTEVFNIFVENLVEKGRSIVVSGSLRDALTLCTEASAGTFVVELSARNVF